MRMILRLTLILPLFAASVLIAAEPPQAQPVLTPVPQSGPYSWTTGTYQYDGSGNITAMGSHTFIYDPLGRLAASHVATTEALSDQRYAYDSFGNMTKVTTNGLDADTPTDALTNHLNASIAAYDDAGNVSKYQPPESAITYGFKYDAFNVMTEESADNVTLTYFVYTAADERLRIEDARNGTMHWRVRDIEKRVLCDFQRSGSWSVYRDYFYRDGALLAATTPTTVEHFTLDHLRSPRLVTDMVGNRLALHIYLPFGKELGPSIDREPLRFTGHERDDDPAGGDSPLDYMRARYYALRASRFLSLDPLADTAGNKSAPQRWNKYVYVENKPLIMTDPSGRFEMLFVMEGGIFGSMGIGLWPMLESGGDGETPTPSEAEADCRETPWTLDLGVSTPLPTGGGLSAGIQASNTGYYYYLGSGFVSSPGVSLIFSASAASAGVQDNAQFNVPGLQLWRWVNVIGSVSHTPGSAWGLKDLSFGAGLGSRGVSVTRNNYFFFGNPDHPIDEMRHFFDQGEIQIRQLYGDPTVLRTP